MKQLLLLAIVLPLGLAGAQPHVGNAKLETRTHHGSLDAELRAIAGPAWAGYEMPAARPRSNSCCYSGGCRGCSLEGGESTFVQHTSKPVELEGSATVVILFRVVGGQVEKIGAYSSNCELDAGGLSFVWLNGVTPAESAAFLESLGNQASGAKHASFGLAVQGGPEAEAALIRLARNAVSGKQRSDALFWLAQRAGQKASAAISEAIDNDPDTAVKKSAVFALSQLPKDEGIPKLIAVASTNRNREVRKQAFFWLGQTNDPRAVEFFEQVLSH